MSSATMRNEPVLVVNFSYEPLNTTELWKAVKLLVKGKAEIARDPRTDKLEADESRTVRAGEVAFPMPLVVRMLYYVARKPNQVPLTKKNVLIRDDHKCGYCLERGGDEMTVDHVKPKSQGGPSSWENLVACCFKCNQRKKNRTPEQAQMPLRRKPYRPQYLPFVVVRRNLTRDTWWKYISLWSVDIEERQV